MRTIIRAPRVRGQLPGVLIAALVLAAPATAGATTPAGAHQHHDAASRAHNPPPGWSAGAVARGTGYHKPGASDRVRDVQRRLDRLGYRAGKVDGLFGPITDGAVHRYQGDRSLTVDGIVGPATLADLRSRTRRVASERSGRHRTSGTRSNGGANSQAPARTGVTPAAGPAPSRSAAERRPAVTGHDTFDWSGLWKLALLVGAVFGVAMGAAMVLLAGMRAFHEAIGRLRRRRQPMADTEGILHGNVYVEGRSADQRVGGFRGFAYAMWPLAGEPGEPAAKPTMLVYDATKPHPVSVHLSEIGKINGRPVHSDASDTNPMTVLRGPEMPPVPRPLPAEPAEVEAGPVASVTSLSARRRRSRPATYRVVRSDKPYPGQLRIERRIERRAVTRSGDGADGNGRGHRGTAPGPDPRHFGLLGVRVMLADGEGMDPGPGILLVHLELFLEGEHRRWETGTLGGGERFAVSADNLEADVRMVVVSRWLEALSTALAKDGVVIAPADLERLRFGVDRTIEVERAIAVREESPLRTA